VGVSRNAVRQVIRSGISDVPSLDRPERLEPYLEQIRTLHAKCRGNLVRVTEKLHDEGLDIRYSTLTAFCRRYEIGTRPKQPSGRYHFAPGEEMQHDTSPHTVTVGGSKRPLQCASLVLCYSRLLYARVYPRWSRFECRIFLTEALTSWGGAASRCMVDNSSVVIASGTGKNAVPSPQMAALAKRFGFGFAAHELGDANRSGRVERPFHYIENNFYPGRTFADLADLNDQLRVWCDVVNQRLKRHIQAIPLERFTAERPHLKPLPIYIPEVYDLYERRVDAEALVWLHTNRYSVPAACIDHKVEVRETQDHVRIFDGHQRVAEHRRAEHGARLKVTLPEHRNRYSRKYRQRPTSEEQRLRSASPYMAPMLDELRQRYGGRAARPIRKLHRLWMEYPEEALQQAIDEALRYGLLDMDRLETMVLRNIAGDFFRLPVPPRTPEDDDG